MSVAQTEKVAAMGEHENPPVQVVIDESERNQPQQQTSELHARDRRQSARTMPQGNRGTGEWNHHERCVGEPLPWPFQGRH